jgi:hypothetical protein
MGLQAMNTRDFLKGRKQRGLVEFVLLSTLLVLMGCGKSKTSVSGKVFLGDQSLKGGNVSFVIADGSSKPASVSAIIDQEGKYTIKDLPPGEYNIAVETESLKPSGSASAHPYKVPDNAPPELKEKLKANYSDEKLKLYVPIPAMYKDVKTSGLSYTVAAGKNEHDINLTEAKK